MMAFSVEETQRKLRTVGAVLIIAMAGLGFVAVGPVLGGGPPPASVASYNVTYMVMEAPADGAGGTAAFFSTATVNIPVEQTNLTMVIFHVSYTDNSISPLFNPTVAVTIQGPDGSGGASGSVPPGQTASFQAAVNNLVPDNQTVEASSPEEALSIAAGPSANATLGVGDWEVVIDVGSPLGGRIRPSGTITYTITVDTRYFVGTAERL